MPLFIPTDPDEGLENEIDAKGDLLVGLAPDDAERLPAGADGEVLAADSTTATGLKWIPAASGGGGGVVDHGDLTGLGDDDHPQYQEEDEKGVADGYASLDGTGTVPDAQLPADLARDAEVAGAIAVHDADTSVHGIPDTTALATDAEVAAAIAAHEIDDPAHAAGVVSIADVGGYFTGTTVEGALQEIGSGSVGGSVEVEDENLIVAMEVFA